MIKKQKKRLGCNLKIVTINVPESYIDTINKLIGRDGLFPSRSELVRCAVREFLMRELKFQANMKKYSGLDLDEIEEQLDEKKFVKVPEMKKDKNGDLVKEFKTYKILRRLEY